MFEKGVREAKTGQGQARDTQMEHNRGSHLRCVDFRLMSGCAARHIFLLFGEMLVLYCHVETLLPITDCPDCKSTVGNR